MKNTIVPRHVRSGIGFVAADKYHLKKCGPLEKFDPDDWARLFVAFGAKFAGPVTEQTDCFTIWYLVLINASRYANNQI